jgi:Kef-type K+ transport system membrane component KefB
MLDIEQGSRSSGGQLRFDRVVEPFSALRLLYIMFLMFLTGLEVDLDVARTHKQENEV